MASNPPPGLTEGAISEPDASLRWDVPGALLKCRAYGFQDGEVLDSELEVIKKRRPLHPPPSPERLVLDYGEKEAKLMTVSFAEANAQAVFGVLNWFGVGSRWREFLAWFRTVPTGGEMTVDAAFDGFARHLGRVQTFRALALDEAGLKKILETDEIFPTGQLRTTAEELAKILDIHGVRKVVVARLYIAHLKKLIGFDPSISLHDDWETTSCIASGYCSPEKPVYLFKVSVPVIEHVGFRLLDVAGMAEPFLGPRYSNHEPWFCFKSPSIPDGIHFDATIQRCERYGLYTVPFLSQRLLGVWKFPTTDTITKAITPFAEEQAKLRKQYPEGQGISTPMEQWPTAEIPRRQ